VDALLISLTPDFSRVYLATVSASRFSGFSLYEKPLKRFFPYLAHCTGLKPGVNENLVTRVRDFI
jgi:hypothetical protein